MQNRHVDMSKQTSKKNSITKINSAKLGMTISEDVNCLILI